MAVVLWGCWRPCGPSHGSQGAAPVPFEPSVFGVVVLEGSCRGPANLLPAASAEKHGQPPDGGHRQEAVVS